MSKWIDAYKADIDKFRTNFVKQTLRKASYRWPARTEAMNEQRVERGKYSCRICGSISPRRLVKMDHTEPVVDPRQGFVSWDEFIKRLFVPKGGFQAICEDCHKCKTKLENTVRSLQRKAIKDAAKSATGGSKTGRNKGNGVRGSKVRSRAVADG